MKITGITRTVCFLFLSVSASYLLYSAAYAKSCGDQLERPPQPYTPGCERLNIVVHNSTGYTFELDTASTTVGTAASSMDEILPDSTNGGPTTLSFDGASVDATTDTDKVDASIRYNATLNGKRIGPQLTIYAKKKSCNVSTAIVIFYDQACYDTPTYCTGYGCHKHCVLNDNCNVGCTYDDGHQEDYVCRSSYRYYGYNCSPNGVDIPSYNSTTAGGADSASSSSVQVDPGLYTVGTTFNSDGSNNGEDATKLYGTYSYFACSKPSECNSSSQGNCDANTTDDTNNKPAVLEFYIKASPIEKLTVKFPFDWKSPMGKILKDAVYNNLNVKYLNSLGSYYSMNPVGFTDASLEFSALCNAEVCP